MECAPPCLGNAAVTPMPWAGECYICNAAQAHHPSFDSARWGGDGQMEDAARCGGMRVAWGVPRKGMHAPPPSLSGGGQIGTLRRGSRFPFNPRISQEQ